MAERKSGPVKPPVIDLKANDPSPAPAPQPDPAAAKPSAADAAPAASARPAEAPRTQPRPPRTETKPRPAPEPPPAAPQPTPPLRQARLAMPWSAISIAAIGGAVLGTALTYALVNLLPMPSSPLPFADPTASLESLESRMATLEATLPELQDTGLKTQLSLDATITQLDTGLTDARTGLEALTARVAAAEAAIPKAATVDLAPLTAQLESLEGRVTAIAAGASSADAAALADSLTSIEASLADLTTRLAAAETTLGGLDGIRSDLAAAKAAIAAQTQTLGGANIGPAVRLPLVVSGLETAFAGGRPFAAELASLKTLLPDLAVPEPLTALAETGLARPDALRADFRTVVPAILAGRTAESTGDWGKDAIEWAKGLLALRPTGEIEGNTPEAIVSRLEAAMERQDFVAATDLLDRLPEAMQSAAGDVGSQIRAHAEADGFIAALRVQALTPTVTEPAAAEATP